MLTAAIKMGEFHGILTDIIKMSFHFKLHEKIECILKSFKDFGE